MHVASGSSITVRFICSSSADTGNPRSLVSCKRALRIQQRANRDLIKSPESTAWANLKFDRVSGRDSVPVLFAVGRRCTAFSLKVSIALCWKLSHAHQSSCLCNKALRSSTSGTVPRLLGFPTSFSFRGYRRREKGKSWPAGRSRSRSWSRSRSRSATWTNAAGANRAQAHIS